MKYSFAVIDYRRPHFLSGKKAREWMSPHAYKCLPMVVANCFGWDVVLNQDVVVTWNGGATPADVKVLHNPDHGKVESAFGLGTITVDLGGTWRTPYGTQLMVMPVPNQERVPFETLTAIVETDHFEYPFFVTLRSRERGTWNIKAGQAIARLVPVRLSDMDGEAILRMETESEKKFRSEMTAARDGSSAPWIRWYHDRVAYPSVRAPNLTAPPDPDAIHSSELETASDMGVEVVENFLPPEDCRALIELIDATPARKVDGESEEWAGRTFDVDFPDDVLEKLDACLVGVVARRWGIDPDEYQFTDLHCVKWPEGTEMEPHTDVAGGKYPRREFAAVVYLNEDYEGGDCVFPDLKMTILPSAGDLLVFKGGEVNHGVSPITRGVRLTAICWIGPKD